MDSDAVAIRAKVLEMICDHCAWEADQVSGGITTHEQLARINEKWMAWGATHSPLGHSACRGGTHCDCHHEDTRHQEGVDVDHEHHWSTTPVLTHPVDLW